MIILELKLAGTARQYAALDEAIRTTQFIRNKCVRYWRATPGATPYDLNKYCAVLAADYDFARKLTSMARQAAADRAAAAIARFCDTCKNKRPGKKGYPRFQKDCRSVEYKTTGWKLDDLRRHLTLTDGFSARTHVCPHCKLVLGRDHNAARNILALGVRRLEHTTAGHAEIHACGQ